MNELRDLSKVTIGQLMQSLDKSNLAEVRRSSDLRPRLAIRIPLELTTARTAQNPLLIPNPFDGFFVEDASDADANVQLSFNGVDQYSTDNYTTLRLNASAKLDTTVKQGVLTWEAQGGKTMTIVFFLGVDFTPGSVLTQIQGSISLISGTTIADDTLGAAGNASSVAVTSASAIVIAPQNSARRSINFYTTNPIWIGPSTVAVGRGTLVNGNFTYENTAELYAIGAGGAATVSGLEEGV